MIAYACRTHGLKQAGYSTMHVTSNRDEVAGYPSANFTPHRYEGSLTRFVTSPQSLVGLTLSMHSTVVALFTPLGIMSEITQFIRTRRYILNPSETKQIGDATTPIPYALTGNDVTAHERNGKNLQIMVGTRYSDEQGGERIPYGTNRRSVSLKWTSDQPRCLDSTRAANQS